MTFTWDSYQYHLTIFQITGNAAFDYFFSMVFTLGCVFWLIGLPLRLLRDKR